MYSIDKLTVTGESEVELIVSVQNFDKSIKKRVVETFCNVLSEFDANEEEVELNDNGFVVSVELYDFNDIYDTEGDASSEVVDERNAAIREHLNDIVDYELEDYLINNYSEYFEVISENGDISAEISFGDDMSFYEKQLEIFSTELSQLKNKDALFDFFVGIYRYGIGSNLLFFFSPNVKLYYIESAGFSDIVWGELERTNIFDGFSALSSIYSCGAEAFFECCDENDSAIKMYINLLSDCGYDVTKDDVIETFEDFIDKSEIESVLTFEILNGRVKQ